MFGLEQNFRKKFVRLSLITVLGAQCVAIGSVTAAKLVGALPTARPLLEISVTSLIALVVTVAVGPPLFWKILHTTQKLEDAKRKLLWQTQHDHLTQLLNRRGFEDHSQKLINFARQQKLPCAMIMCDIDRFKAINDTYGHTIGDRVISLVAEQIKSIVNGERFSKVAIGRMGGEEYGVISIGLTRDQAADLAEKIRRATSAIKLDVDGNVIAITVSVGATVMSYRDAKLDTLLVDSDRAMYKAKEMGRDRTELSAITQSSRRVA